MVGHFIPLEFTDRKEQYYYESIRFFGFPIAILLTLTGTVKNKDHNGVKFGKIILTVLTSLAVFYFSGLAILGDMCQWSTERIVFESKIDSDKIVIRSFGCGATDSGSPTYGTFKVKYFTRHFILATPIDTTRVDQTLWKRIDSVLSGF